MNASAAASMPAQRNEPPVRDRPQAALGAVAVVALEEGDAALRRPGEREGERGVVAEGERLVPERPGVGEQERLARADPRNVQQARARRRPSSGSVAPASSQEPAAPATWWIPASSCRGASDAHPLPRLPRAPDRAGSTRWCSQPNADPAATSRPPRSTKRRRAARVRLLDDARVGEHERRAGGVELELARALAQTRDRRDRRAAAARRRRRGPPRCVAYAEAGGPLGPG